MPAKKTTRIYQSSTNGKQIWLVFPTSDVLFDVRINEADSDKIHFDFVCKDKTTIDSKTQAITESQWEIYDGEIVFYLNRNDWAEAYHYERLVRVLEEISGTSNLSILLC